MAHRPRNAAKHWTPPQVEALKALANSNTPTRVIGIKLGRSEPAIYAKASSEGISLKPSNQSPYGRKRK